MTPKELLYIEDALGHQKTMETSCNGFISQITDPELKSFVQQMANRHGSNFNKLLTLLNV